ncbi:hypothetical protein EJ110_NYTH07422 [Nymphaea thermarum]|nr:hypothetical protein EJ110_NYTH07422 [Nymphaea thermarum]
MVFIFIITRRQVNIIISYFMKMKHSSISLQSKTIFGGHILDSYKNRLGVKTMEALICAQDWLYCEGNKLYLCFE